MDQQPGVESQAVKPAESYSVSRIQKTSSIKTPLLIACVIIAVLALVLSIFNTLSLDKKLDESQLTSQVEAMEKRIKAVEDDNSFTEKEVKTEQYQALFLEGGQVYFGKVTAVTQDTMKLEDIYYLQSGTVDRTGIPSAGADVKLVKLGKELHSPEDVMVVERKNLLFWENLQDDGQVATAISRYKMENPTQ